MKKVNVLGIASVMAAMSFMAPGVGNAQPGSVIGINIANEKQLHHIVSYSLFTPSTVSHPVLDREIRNVVYLKLNKQALHAIMQQKNPLIAIALPLDGGTKQLTLNNYNILDEGFKVYERGSDGIKKEISVPLGQFYRGIVEGSDNSLAGFTFQDNSLGAVFSTADGGNYNLVPNYRNPGADNDEYILFREKDIVNGSGFKCGVQESGAMNTVDDGTAGRNAFNSCHKLRVSMHGDYKLYQRSQSNMANATAYLTLLFNMDAVLYNNEGINAVLSEIVVHNAPDGYTFGGSDEVLVKFAGETLTNFNGDIAQMVTGYRQQGYAPLGGLAWLDVLCQAPFKQVDQQTGDTIWVGPYSMVNNNIINDIEQVPIYSWDVEASTHEIGHNIGSPHTQSCTWPGGAIDDCCPVEGNCSPGAHPGINEGTIMSYCHLNYYAVVGIGFAYGFGPLPGARIRSRIASKSCLSSFKPAITLTTANTERIANRQCNDGDWTYFYYDNNTADETDDELLLMIDANGQDIGDVDVTGMVVKMKTQSYGSNTGRSTTAPYGAVNWTEFNRTWSISLPSTVTQPTGAVGIRFPYTNQDVLDVKGTYANAAETSLQVVAFNNQAAANSPATALAADVNFYSNTTGAASNTKWKKGTAGNYNYAEFITNSGVFGGSMGFKNSATGIGDVKGSGTLNIYPNPASAVLHIEMPEHLQANESVITIVDNLGRVRSTSASINGSQVAVDIAGLSAGVYCVRINTNGQSFNGFFVKK